MQVSSPLKEPLELSADLVGKKASYRFLLAGKDSRVGRSPEYAVVVEPDTAPRVDLVRVGQEVILPNQNAVKLAINDVVPVAGKAWDDVAVDKVRLRIRGEDGRELKQHGKNGNRATPEITRFKGLGEMMPKVLWETTLNPRTRRLLRVDVTDQLATDRVINELMGKDASARFRFIMERADEAEELDV